MKHVTAISKNPHPIGSSAHEAVRDYIVQTLLQVGLHPEIQNATGVSEKFRSAGSVQNIVVQVPGSSPSKAVLVVGHYDSVPTSFGASDDGTAVAAMLECASALKRAPRLRRDVVFLFTDGEENGLLGAQAFVAHNPLAKNIGFVLNFDTRGVAGPSIMFETSNDNAWLIQIFQRGCRRPVANSLTYQIYKHLPNDTDFSVFKGAGYSGLNFAFIDGLAQYHTALDNRSDLDIKSLQHQGDNLLEMAREFANTTTEDPRRTDAVYFDLMGRMLVSYSTVTAIILTVITSILFASVLIVTLKQRFLDIRSLFLGLIASVATIVAAALGAAIVGWLLASLGRAVPDIQSGFSYHNELYAAGCAAIGLACALGVLAKAYSRVSAYGLAAGALLFWYALLLLTIVAAPGASYLFLWPLLFTLGGWLIVLGSGSRTLKKDSSLLILAGIPGIVLTLPLAHELITAFGVGAGSYVATLLALQLGLIVAPIGVFPALRGRMATQVAGAAGLVLFIIGLTTTGYNNAHPRRDSVLYALDADAGRAIWLTYDQKPDAWTSQFFASGATRARLSNLFPGADRQFLEAPAPAFSQPAPLLTVLENEHNGGEQRFVVRLQSQRNAPLLWISFVSRAPVRDVRVNHELLFTKLKSGEGFIYNGLPATGMELSFRASVSDSVQLQVKDVSFGLPSDAAGGSRRRPGNVIAAPQMFNDSTIVKKTFTL
ncbi:MAG TPA: M20/M25/M40 family metallo-hydrolase [Bryobacteraceae bacterium]|jgi:hypothetical protein|nr:M20/M25/M40 family metallo-hydrolase [Bryobacteraceae bacterium]